MKAGRIIWVYALALAFGVFLQFDRVGPWLSAKFGDAMPAWLAAVEEDVLSLHQDSGLTGLGLALDCSTAGLFDDTYKNTYRCQDPALAMKAPSPGPSVSTSESDAGQASQDAVPAKEKLRSGNVLVVGDSLAVSLAVSLDKVFREYQGLNMVAKGKIASGLENPQYYDWTRALEQFVGEYNPQLVVVMMGANDAKYLNLDPDSPEPVALPDRKRSLYQTRLEKFLSVMDEKGIMSYWVGLPVMGDPDLSNKSRALNDIVRQACQASAHARFMDTWSLLAGPDGAYSQHITDASGRRVRVREGDKIHFSTAGGDIIVKAFMKDMAEDVEMPPRSVKEVAEARPATEFKKR